MLGCCGAAKHPWDEYEVDQRWVPRPLLCLIIGENPGDSASEYFYSVPAAYTTDEVVVRRCLLQGLYRQGLIAEASLDGFRNAGFLFDHAIRCQLPAEVVRRERQKAIRYASGQVADPTHLTPLLAEAKIVWVMGHLASNAVANATGDFPKERRRLSRAPYPAGVSASPKFFVSEYLTWRNEDRAPDICTAFARFARARSVFRERQTSAPPTTPTPISRPSTTNRKPSPSGDTKTAWPKKPEREQLEINGFLAAYARLPESPQLEIVAKGEMPDYTVKDVRTGQEYGVELTSVYLDDRSVPDVHMREDANPVKIPYDETEVERYRRRLVAAIIEKICKARKAYDRARPLILAVYINEYISIYLRESDFREFARRYNELFEAMTPFSEIVFWNLPNGSAVRVQPRQRLTSRSNGPGARAAHTRPLSVGAPLDCRGEAVLSYPRHSRERFFKYTSASTAIKILEAGTVRYSSPLLFNDPFDVQSGLHFDFDVASLSEKLFRRIEDLVTSPTRPNVAENDPWGEVVLFMWDRRITHGFPRERVWEACEPLFGDLKDEIADFQAKYQQIWNEFLPRLRVFSVTEERDNLLMWSHYGQSHTGAVFEFLVLPGEDNPLCVAQPVIYRSAPPPLFTEQQWLDDILSVHPLDLDEQYFRYAYVKSDVWSYEKEWRVWDLLPDRRDTLFSDSPLRPNEVGSVYLGCKMDPPSKKSVLSLLSGKYPKARVFQAWNASDQFRLYFDAI